MLDSLLGFSPNYANAMATADTSGEVNDLTTKAEFMEYRINALELACAGMWKLLKQNGYTDDQLSKAIEEADRSDGKRDRHLHHKPGVCPRCGRPILTRSRAACVWCGSPLPPQLPD